jgi:hypothetical protein
VRSVSLRRPGSGGGPAQLRSSSPRPAQRQMSLSEVRAAASAPPHSVPSPPHPRRRTVPPRRWQQPLSTPQTTPNCNSNSSSRRILTVGPPMLRVLAAGFLIHGRRGGQVPRPPRQPGLALLQPPADPGLFISLSESRIQHPPHILLLLGRRAANRPDRQVGSPWRRVATLRRRQ